MADTITVSGNKNQQTLLKSVTLLAQYGGAYGIRVPQGNMTPDILEKIFDKFRERKDHFVEARMSNDKVSSALSNIEGGDLTKDEKAQARQKVDGGVENYAVRQMKSELAAMIAYRYGVEGSKKINAVEGEEKQFKAGKEYLNSLKGSSKAEESRLYDRINAEAKSIVQNFDKAYTVVSAKLDELNGFGFDLGQSLHVPDTRINAQPSTQQSASTEPSTRKRTPESQETQTQVVKVPDRTLTDETIARNKTVQEIVNHAIQNINGLPDSARESLGIKGRLTPLNRQDGQWDRSTLDSFNDLLDGLKKGLNLGGKFPDSGYSSELGEAIDKALDSEFAKKVVVDNFIFPDGGRAKLIKALDKLSQDNELRPVKMIEKTVSQQKVPDKQKKVDGGTGSDQKVEKKTKPVQNNRKIETKAKSKNGSGDDSKDDPKGDKPNQATVDFARIAVEGLLFKVGNNIGDIPGARMLGSLGGLRDTILPKLNKSEIGGEFGAKSQDLTAKLMMTLKTAAGFKDANGDYNPQIGEALKFQIMMNPNLGFVREKMMGDGKDAPPCMGVDPVSGKILAEGSAGYAKQKQLYDMLQQHIKSEPKKPDSSNRDATDKYNKIMEQRKVIDERYSSEIAGIKKANEIFDYMNVLHANGDLMNSKEARAVNRQNMMMDIAGAALQKFAPGLMKSIEGFFKNSPIGQMISTMLGYKGFDISRLWGGKTDVSDKAVMDQKLQDNFDSIYDAATEEAKKSNPNPTNQEVMKAAQELAKDGNNGVIKKAMGFIFKGKDQDVTQEQLIKSLKDAQNAGSKAEAKNIFMDSVRASLDGRDYSPATQEDINRHIESVKEVNISEVNTPNVNIPHDPSKVIVAADVIKAGDQNVRLLFEPNKRAFVQGNLRLSKGRVQDLQEVLADNAKNLGLSLDPENMKIDGQFSDRATPCTCAVLEETLIHAKIHAWEESGKDISQSDLNGLKADLAKPAGLGTMLNKNLSEITSYMKAKGVSDADIAKFRYNVESLANDYHSTNLDGDPEQETSVLEQSFFGGQFNLDLANFVPDNKLAHIKNPVEAKTAAESIYKQYNKDGTQHEMPVFYMKEGSNSVFAAIHDKHRNQGEPEYKELEFHFYKTQNDINSGDYDDVRELLENYNFGQKDGESIEISKQRIDNAINKALGLKPKEYDLDIKQQVKQQPASPKVKADDPAAIAARVGTPNYGDARKDPPKSFTDYTKLSNHVKVNIERLLGLESNKSVASVSARDHRDLLDVYFDQKVGNRQQTGLVFLELDRFNIHDPNADVVMGIRDSSGHWDFRVVDYDKDQVTSLRDRREDKCNDIKNLVDPTKLAYRPLEQTLYNYHKGNGGIISQMPYAKSGLVGMAAIVPNSSSAVNGFKGVYDCSDRRDMDTYLGYSNANYNLRTAYENGSTPEKIHSMMRQYRRELDRRYGGGDFHNHGQGGDHVSTFNRASGSFWSPVNGGLWPHVPFLSSIGRHLEDFKAQNIFSPHSVAGMKWRYGMNIPRAKREEIQREQAREQQIREQQSDCGCPHKSAEDRQYDDTYDNQRNNNNDQDFDIEYMGIK